MTFQQPASPSPLFALRILAFLVAMLSGNALENEENTCKRKNRNNAWNESCRFHNGPLFSANWTAEPEGARRPEVLSRPFEAAAPDELGMTRLAEKGQPFSARK